MLADAVMRFLFKCVLNPKKNIWFMFLSPNTLKPITFFYLLGLYWAFLNPTPEGRTKEKKYVEFFIYSNVSFVSEEVVIIIVRQEIKCKLLQTQTFWWRFQFLWVQDLRVTNKWCFLCQPPNANVMQRVLYNCETHKKKHAFHE
jgi:hypothetical protein